MTLNEVLVLQKQYAKHSTHRFPPVIFPSIVLRSDGLQRGEGRDPINQFNPATLLCLELDFSEFS